MRQFEYIEDIRKYRLYLLEMERSTATIEKYLRDIRKFSSWLGSDREVTKERVIEYKHALTAHYKTSSVNSMLVALNMYFRYLGWEECCVRGLKCQQQMFIGSRKELRQEEYLRLVETALQKGQEQIALVMETIASTGIRISELRYITVEAVQQGCANVNCKGKSRQVFIVKELRKKLLKYLKQKKIISGPIFLSQKGNPLDRSNVWAKMKFFRITSVIYLRERITTKIKIFSISPTSSAMPVSIQHEFTLELPVKITSAYWKN